MTSKRLIKHDVREYSREIGESDGLGSAPAAGRGATAVRRDQAATDRDLAANARDGVARAADLDERSSSPRSRDQRWERRSARDRLMAASDRVEAALDREQAAEDRRLSSDGGSQEGLDSLTGVMGRRTGLAAVEREISRGERTGESLVVALVDTVGLEAINQDRGHAAGDRVLQDIAECICDDVRDYDLVTRVGGDEFVCAQAGQSIVQAEVRYGEIARRLAELPSGARITFGLAARRRGDSLKVLVDRAGEAMSTSGR